jgi:hypothetical protein
MFGDPVMFSPTIAARIMRMLAWAERQAAKPDLPELENPPFEVMVKVTNGTPDDDGLYEATYVLLNPITMVLEELDECLAYGINAETLTVDTVYKGYTVRYMEEDDLDFPSWAVVELIVPGGDSGGSVTITQVSDLLSGNVRGTSVNLTALSIGPPGMYLVTAHVVSQLFDLTAETYSSNMTGTFSVTGGTGTIVNQATSGLLIAASGFGGSGGAAFTFWEMASLSAQVEITAGTGQVTLQVTEAGTGAARVVSCTATINAIGTLY